MSNFDFVLLLLSFVYALALGHVLVRVGGLLIARDRVVFSGLLALTIFNAMTQVYIDWLAMWDYHSIDAWDLPTVTLFFVAAILIFLMCVAASPETPADETIDMEAFYQKQYRLFYGLYIILLVVFVAMCFVQLRTPNPELALKQSLSNLPGFALSFLAFFVPARWAQWVAGISLLVLSIAWLIAYSSVLHRSPHPLSPTTLVLRLRSA
jgi:hypothetical protein